jgi:rubrerythrin
VDASQGVEAVKTSIELHIGCGGVVSLAHEVWRCAKCGASPVPVTEIDLITGKAAEERTEKECPDCRRIAEEDGDILPPACFAHGGSPKTSR